MHTLAHAGHDHLEESTSASQATSSMIVEHNKNGTGLANQDTKTLNDQWVYFAGAALVATLFIGLLTIPLFLESKSKTND